VTRVLPPEAAGLEVSRDWLLVEASRCLDCFDPPCQKACPASIPVPRFIRSIRSGNFGTAAKLVREANPMAAMCGAVCPQEVFCQFVCTRGKIDSPIRIRELHAFATGLESSSGRAPSGRATVPSGAGGRAGKLGVAVIGAGPCGLSCAVELARLGEKVQVFEQHAAPGGTPIQAVPRFRLSDDLIAQDTERALRGGVSIVLKNRVGAPEALGEYEAVLVSPGLTEDKNLGVPNEESAGVVKASAFLRLARSGSIESLAGKKIVVIGGGNVSLDVASSAADMGAREVRVLYRRGPREIRVWKGELEGASARGVTIDYQVQVLEFLVESKRLAGVRCVATRLSDTTDADGRRVASPVEGTEFTRSADFAVVSVGLDSSYQRDVTVNSDLSTSKARVFAGGDWARGPRTIVEAVRDGKQVAEAMAAYLCSIRSGSGRRDSGRTV
jgi:NADPH-dependent glutamate synthase beta subunit-like oxidoreductase